MYWGDVAAVAMGWWQGVMGRWRRLWQVGAPLWCGCGRVVVRVMGRWEDVLGRCGGCCDGVVAGCDGEVAAVVAGWGAAVVRVWQGGGAGDGEVGGCIGAMWRLLRWGGGRVCW